MLRVSLNSQKSVVDLVVDIQKLARSVGDSRSVGDLDI